MSNLLINEYPLMVLPGLATAIGLNEAIVLQQIHYWIQHYKAADDRRHFRDGHWWVWNTYEQWQENFPFWSKATIKRTMTRLREATARQLGCEGSTKKPLVICKTLNSKPYDRTLWYRIDYEELHLVQVRMPKQRRKTAKVQNGPIPTEHIAPNHSSNLIPPIPETTQRLPKDTSADEKRPRVSSGKNAIRKALEEHFISKTKIPPPLTKTVAQQKAAGAKWWQPLRRMAQLCEWDERKGRQLIDAALLRLAGFTIVCPKSIVGTAEGIIGERARGIIRSSDGAKMAVGPSSRARSRGE